MINYAIGLFVVAALGGAVMALTIFKGKLAPWAVSLLHAALGAAGLVILLVALVDGGLSQLAIAALIVLGIAAVGGFFLASIHARKVVAPKAIVLVHAIAAVIGVTLLIVSVL